MTIKESITQLLKAAQANLALRTTVIYGTVDVFTLGCVENHAVWSTTYNKNELKQQLNLWFDEWARDYEFRKNFIDAIANELKGNRLMCRVDEDLINVSDGTITYGLTRFHTPHCVRCEVRLLNKLQKAAVDGRPFHG